MEDKLNTGSVGLPMEVEEVEVSTKHKPAIPHKL